VNFFTDVEFRGFQQSLDAEMKRLRSEGIGVTRKRAEPISVKEEGELWEKGILGDSSPQVLLDTMVYCCGVYFALRSGEEHRSLKVTQLQLFEPSGERPYVCYTENAAKNNHGGFSQRKLEPKQVIHHANVENPARCFVRLYKSYMQHRPTNLDVVAFYLTPLKKPRGIVWYSHIPVGHNTLSKTVKRICGAGGVGGYKTNHSLRVTSATCLFQNGAEEQLIMGVTGHHSTEGVCTYKRVSSEQQEALSDILNTATNGKTPTTGTMPTNDTGVKKCKVEGKKITLALWVEICSPLDCR